MIDKDNLPDCESCALKAGAEAHELISAIGNVPGFMLGSVFTRAH